jgi:hypothetical protein
VGSRTARGRRRHTVRGTAWPCDQASQLPSQWRGCPPSRGSVSVNYTRMHAYRFAVVRPGGDRGTRARAAGDIRSRAGSVDLLGARRRAGIDRFGMQPRVAHYAWPRSRLAATLPSQTASVQKKFSPALLKGPACSCRVGIPGSILQTGLSA